MANTCIFWPISDTWSDYWYSYICNGSHGTWTVIPSLQCCLVPRRSEKDRRRAPLQFFVECLGTRLTCAHWSLAMCCVQCTLGGTNHRPVWSRSHHPSLQMVLHGPPPTLPLVGGSRMLHATAACYSLVSRDYKAGIHVAASHGRDQKKNRCCIEQLQITSRP